MWAFDKHSRIHCEHSAGQALERLKTARSLNADRVPGHDQSLSLFTAYREPYRHLSPYGSREADRGSDLFTLLILLKVAPIFRLIKSICRAQVNKFKINKLQAGRKTCVFFGKRSEAKKLGLAKCIEDLQGRIKTFDSKVGSLRSKVLI